MPAAKALPLPHGPLTETAVYLCIDMQRIFAEQTAWHVPWMKRVLPVIVRVARAFPARTVFTRFIPPVRAADAEGMWRHYYQRWSEFTRERLPPHFLSRVAAGTGRTRSARSGRGETLLLAVCGAPTPPEPTGSQDKFDRDHWRGDRCMRSRCGSGRSGSRLPGPCGLRRSVQRLRRGP